jgi:hypothetical protein
MTSKRSLSPPARKRESEQNKKKRKIFAIYMKEAILTCDVRLCALHDDFDSWCESLERAVRARDGFANSRRAQRSQKEIEGKERQKNN